MGLKEVHHLWRQTGHTSILPAAAGQNYSPPLKCSQHFLNQQATNSIGILCIPLLKHSYTKCTYQLLVWLVRGFSWIVDYIDNELQLQVLSSAGSPKASARPLPQSKDRIITQQGGGSHTWKRDAL